MLSTLERGALAVKGRDRRIAFVEYLFEFLR
jgi:hypothetical protein